MICKEVPCEIILPFKLKSKLHLPLDPKMFSVAKKVIIAFWTQSAKRKETNHKIPDSAYHGSHHSRPGTGGDKRGSSLTKKETGIPCRFPELVVRGVLMSACASTQRRARFSRMLAWPDTEPMPILWSPPRTSTDSPFFKTWETFWRIWEYQSTTSFDTDTVTLIIMCSSILVITFYYVRLFFW